ncbi:L2 minor capsid protein [Bos taurus papillomavirus 40]|nr:L2 minor capsid protein [Bos taurus papillomavirus 40]
MVKAVRRKRASEDDLYRGCLQGQYCPPDIKAKYEQNTVADKILKWVSSFLFFGGLGIGTGRGSGGSGGYTRLGTRPEGGYKPNVTPGKSSNAVVPNILVDAIAPTGVPIDPISPDVSIVPVLEESGTTTTIDLPGEGPGEIEIVAEVHPPPTNGNDSVIIGGETEAPVLEVTPEQQPASRIKTTVSKHNNPAFTAFVSSAQLPGESAVSDNVYVLHGFAGEIIGPDPEPTVFEEIPLETFNEAREPQTSTPESSFRRVLNQFQRRLYNRKLVQQVRVTNRTFLTQPSQLVRWEFENPVYEPDISYIFQQDVNEVSAAPVSDFQDVTYLSRPYFSEREGVIRVSRLGKKSSIRTRSGLTVGAHVHYFTDLSPINDVHDIEMQTFGTTSSDSVIMQPMQESTLINDLEEGVLYDPETPLLEEFQGQELFPDETLEDTYEENFNKARLEISSTEKSRSVVTIIDNVGIPPGSVKVFISDYDSVVHHTDTSGDFTPDSPDYINPTVNPAIIIDLVDPGADYYLHPSLFLKRRRKRKYF